MNPAPWQCRWPRGCDQPIGLVDGRADDLCGYHWKVLAGHIDADLKEFRKNRGMKASNVASDERSELAHVLQVLGAREPVIQRALNREPDRR